MKFKDYLSLTEKNGSSRQIWSWMHSYRLPMSPKFFEQVFYNDKKSETCFIAMKFDRIDSLKRRQHKKNQMSSFQKTKDTLIFWGAGNLSWKTYTIDNETIVAEVQGQITLRGNSDLWAFADAQGRRWIDVKGIVRYGTNLTNSLNDIIQELRTIYLNKIPELNLEVPYHYTPKGNIVFSDIDNYPKDKAKLIKTYIDISYDLLKKYKNKLLNIVKEEPLAPKAHYQETLCYNYSIKKLWIITDDKQATLERHKDELNGLDYEFTTPEKLMKHVNSSNKD